jgi:glycine cleavage system H protein
VFGERFGDVESVKAVSELFSPLSGKVIAVNDDLADAPEKLNENPLETWILKIDGHLDSSKLMDESTYLSTLKD